MDSTILQPPGNYPGYWVRTDFDHFATLQRGKDLTRDHFTPGSIPVAGSNGVIGYHDTANVKAPGITVGRSGSVGKVTFYRQDFWAHNTALFVKDFHGNVPAFIAFFLDFLRLGRFGSGASVPTLDRNVFRTLPIVIPPRCEQRKIAAVLGQVQHAIEQQERLIALSTELKKALLHKLFTEGLRGEPQKQTEIGPVPESWELAPCEKLCDMITVGVVVKPASHYVSKGVPAFRSFNVREDCLKTNDLVFFSEEHNDKKLAKSKLRTGDVLVVRTGYPGTSCVVPKEYDGSNCIDLVIVRPKGGVIRSGFLSRFFNAPAGKSQAAGSTHGLAQQHLNVSAVKRTLVPVPSLLEQDEIDSALATVQRKIALVSAKKETLTYLFRTLLHQLMTARIRLHDLDLSEEDIKIVGEKTP
jgi:type I restriction enzyme, S subunit